ncbi:MAG: DUF3108 domain-containing protein [Thermoanaerobaculales bacterium]|jgi:hypothetical protein|nr:DUF3108 domain-containing protein [Thermoanaerobaculales bacterium]
MVPQTRRRAFFVVILMAAAGLVGAEQPAAQDGDPYPIGERLSYSVWWMGMHCGEMEISSWREPATEGPPTIRITVLARTTPFFDGVYRVRSRLDSFVDPVRGASFRYEEHSTEKKRTKNDVWVVSEDRTRIVRTRDGETTVIPVEVEDAFDPLAFIFRLRTIGLEPGTEQTLGLMTSRGAVETVARVTERDRVKTPAGRCDAVAIVPEPRDRMMFSKSGSMIVWVDRAAPHRPCRIEFDLAFGKLSARLRSVEAADGEIADWRTWGDEPGAGR